MIACIACKRNTVRTRQLNDKEKTFAKGITVVKYAGFATFNKCFHIGCDRTWLQCDLTCRSHQSSPLRHRFLRHLRNCHSKELFPVCDGHAVPTVINTPTPILEMDSFDIFQGDDDCPLDYASFCDSSLTLENMGDTPVPPLVLVNNFDVFIDDVAFGGSLNLNNTGDALIPSTALMDISVNSMFPATTNTLRSYTHSFKSESLNTHLMNCRTHGYYVGVCRLVSRSAFQTSNPPNNPIPGPWLMVYFNITKIVLDTKEESHAVLSSILSFVFPVLRYFMGKIYPNLPLPLTLANFQSMILNASNTHSLRSILPLPHFNHNPATEHTILSPTELVPMTMFMPPNSSVIDGVCDRYKSTIKSESFFERRNRIPSTYRTLENSVTSVLVYITLWSDGWDPNQSGKANRSPVWSATGTMIFVELGSVDIPYLANTALLGVGPGKKSHDEFFEMLVNEKNDLWEEPDGLLKPFAFYSRHHNRTVNVFITVALALQDNPERRGCAYLLGGNSNTHGVYGISCDFELLSVPFPACLTCQTSMDLYARNGNFSSSSVIRACKDCLGWSLDKLCEVGLYNTDKPRADGLSLAPHEFGYRLLIGPGRIEFGDCIVAWRYVTDQFLSGNWTATKSKAYLKLFCCNEELQKKFLFDARLYLNIEAASQDDAEDNFDPEDLAFFRNLSNTPKHCLPRHPGIWSLFLIVDITETPMHLAMGVIKALLRTLLESTVCRDRQQVFIQRCNEIIKTIQDLRIDLVPVLKFKNEKFGGFVAENYGAMAMIFPFLSHILEEDIMKPPILCSIPNLLEKPLENWNRKETTAWLRDKGIIGYSKLSAAEAKSMVSSLMNDPSGRIPESVPNPGRDMPHGIVRRLLFLANSLFSAIMLSDLEGENAKNRAQCLVGLFLSQYDDVHKTLVPKREKPIWSDKYNMLGLLRVPEHFIRHRHFRNQYEGGLLGEGMVKQLRKLCPNAVREGWSRNMIKTFYRNQSLDALFHEAQTEHAPSWKWFTTGTRFEQSVSDGRLRKFRRYRDLDDIREYFNKGYPISVIGYKVGLDDSLKFACVRSKSKTWTLFFISVSYFGDTYIDPNGYIYFSVSLNGGLGTVVERSLDLQGHVFNCFAVLLPDLWSGKSTNGNYKYAVVNEDWEKLDRLGKWTCLYP